MADFDKIQHALGYQFKDSNLLKNAVITLKANSQLHNFERLEFLGDRILGLVIAEYLLEAFPEEDEGDIAKRHASLVCQDALVNIAEKIDIPQILNVTKKEIPARYKSYLSDICEAMIGAIYLDGGLSAAEKFILENWIDLFKKSNKSPPPRDPKTTLQEWLQSQAMALPKYELIETSGPDHEPIFRTQVHVENHPPATGEGRSKKQAEQNAAENFLKTTKAE